MVSLRRRYHWEPINPPQSHFHRHHMGASARSYSCSAHEAHSLPRMFTLCRNSEDRQVPVLRLSELSRLYENALTLGADRAAAAYADTGVAAGERTSARYYERLRSPTSGGQKTVQACRKAGSSVCGPECTRDGKHRWWPRGLYQDQQTGCLKAATVPAAPGLWTGEG